MRVVVTGGAGFIGSHVTEAYLAEGHEVLVLDDLSSGHAENIPQQASFEQADIRSPQAADALRRFRPEVLNHHAAQMNVRVSVDDPCLDADINVVGFLRLLEAGREVGLRRVIFASSGGTVYGDPAKFPCPESEPTHPICPYGVSKLSGESYLYYYDRIYGIHHVALRYANVYGPRQDPHGEAGVIAIFNQRFLRNENVVIFGDGLQTRDYVYVGDVVRANLAALETEFRGPVNIGTGIETDVVSLCARVKELVGGSGEAQHGPAKDGEVRRSSLDVSRAADVLDWRPLTGLSEGLASTVDFFRARS